MRKSPGRELWWSKEFSDHSRVRRYDGEPVGTRPLNITQQVYITVNACGEEVPQETLERKARHPSRDDASDTGDWISERNPKVRTSFTPKPTGARIPVWKIGTAAKILKDDASEKDRRFSKRRNLLAPSKSELFLQTKNWTLERVNKG